MLRAEALNELEDGGQRVLGRGPDIRIKVSDEDVDPSSGGGMDGDPAIAQFSTGSIRAQTNQQGVGQTWGLIPGLAAVSSTFPNPESLRTARHPVPDFWVYDGAHPGLMDRGKIATTREQVMPDRRIREQDAVEWQRVGAKKGWMFNGPPQENAPGFSGENTPTHTNDGFISRVQDNKWMPTPRSAEKQGLATRDMPKIDTENNARGIGVTGPGSGSGGMAGGYQEINQERLAHLPIPMEKYNWTGTRLRGTGREDQGGSELGSGAGGYRAGYASKYPDRPSFPTRRTAGLSRVTQNAA